MNNIAIIGAGQLGSRHLQSLASLDTIDIQVVDPSSESLSTAESRFNEVNKDFQGTISFHNEISELNKILDVVIVATNAKVRKGVVEELVNQSTVQYLILEKFLFTTGEEYTIIGNVLKNNNIKAWVNCPRRMMPFYQELQADIVGPIHFSATGNAWGMGCNGVHLLDLFAFLAKSDEVILSNKLIDKKIEKSKRAGYLEFTGSITGYASNNSFQITSFPNGASGLNIKIDTPTARYSIEEGANGKVWVSKAKDNWEWKESEFKMPFQSELTAPLVDKLLNSGNCMLTPYNESAKLHLSFLDNLISFLREVNNDISINECLIT